MDRRDKAALDRWITKEPDQFCPFEGDCDELQCLGEKCERYLKWCKEIEAVEKQRKVAA